MGHHQLRIRRVTLEPRIFCTSSFRRTGLIGEVTIALVAFRSLRASTLSVALDRCQSSTRFCSNRANTEIFSCACTTTICHDTLLVGRNFETAFLNFPCFLFSASHIRTGRATGPLTTKSRFLGRYIDWVASRLVLAVVCSCRSWGWVHRLGKNELDLASTLGILRPSREGSNHRMRYLGVPLSGFDVCQLGHYSFLHVSNF